MLLHKHAYIARLFGDLRFIVIDEVHSLMRGDRGGQTLCLIERLSKLAGGESAPDRPLSATIGDMAATGRFLSAGTGRKHRDPAHSGRRHEVAALDGALLHSGAAVVRRARGAGSAAAAGDENRLRSGEFRSRDRLYFRTHPWKEVSWFS